MTEIKQLEITGDVTGEASLKGKRIVLTSFGSFGGIHPCIAGGAQGLAFESLRYLAAVVYSLAVESWIVGA